MPVRRIVPRQRRPDLSSDRLRGVLEHGHDFAFADIEQTLVHIPEGQLPDSLLKEAWQEIGGEIVAEHGRNCWGWKRFGPPPGV